MANFHSSFNFTAQARNLSAFMRLHSRTESANNDLTDRLPILVFMAFTIESYINSIGYRVFSDWTNNERKPWRWKIEQLHASTSNKLDWNSSELSLVSTIFNIRDKLAHGKPERVEGPEFTTLPEAENYLRNAEPVPAWLSPIDARWVEGSREKLEGILEYLARIAGLAENDYLHSHTAQALPAAEGDA